MAWELLLKTPQRIKSCFISMRTLPRGGHLYLQPFPTLAQQLLAKTAAALPGAPPSSLTRSEGNPSLLQPAEQHCTLSVAHLRPPRTPILTHYLQIVVSVPFPSPLLPASQEPLTNCSYEGVRASCQCVTSIFAVTTTMAKITSEYS